MSNHTEQKPDEKGKSQRGQQMPRQPEADKNKPKAPEPGRSDPGRSDKESIGQPVQLDRERE
jgi:hypothetical protein